MAGDFNAVLSSEDSSSEHVTKKRTTELLKEIIAENHLIDMASYTNKKQHTWYRRNNNKISSRLDLILTNLPIVRPKYSITVTIFDHTWVQASFGQAKQAAAPSMKDFVLGSDEFLIGFYEILEQRLTTCRPQTEHASMDTQEPMMPSTRRQGNHNDSLASSSLNTSGNSREDDLDQSMAGQEDDQDRTRHPMDFGLSAHDVHSGRTDLHFINDLLLELTTLHRSIERNLRALKQQKLEQTSRRLYYLHKKINKQPNDHPEMVQDQDEYNELQRNLRLDAELLETAKQMRIQNFYK